MGIYSGPKTPLAISSHEIEDFLQSLMAWLYEKTENYDLYLAYSVRRDDTIVYFFSDGTEKGDLFRRSEKEVCETLADLMNKCFEYVAKQSD